MSKRMDHNPLCSSGLEVRVWPVSVDSVIVA